MVLWFRDSLSVNCHPNFILLIKFEVALTPDKQQLNVLVNKKIRHKHKTVSRNIYLNILVQTYFIKTSL